MTGNKLPPFSELKPAGKPTEPPPFHSLKQVGEVSKPVNTHPKALAAAANKKASPKLTAKRKKQAVDIADFALQHSKGHAMFFRHIRVPDDNNLDYRDQPLPGPKGGATVLVDLIDEDAFTFSFAICNLEENDAYVKDEARKMCQDRFRSGQICKVTGRDGPSCFMDISQAIHNYFRELTEGPQLQVIGSQIADDSLATLQRYIRKYGNSSLDGDSWPYTKK